MSKSSLDYEKEIKYDIDAHFKKQVLAQQLYDVLITVSDTYKDQEVTVINVDGESKPAIINGRHDEKYNVVQMVRSLLKDKNTSGYQIHNKTIEILEIIHTKLCSQGY